MLDSTTYPAATPHDPIEELFPRTEPGYDPDRLGVAEAAGDQTPLPDSSDLFLVHGSVRMGPGVRISRNMVIVRQNQELTLISPVRLSAIEEAKLEALGTVAHVMRIGYFHGLDDRYYVDRYGAQFWCQAGSDNYAEPKADHRLEEEGTLPISEAELFVFKETKHPECALLLRRHGGVLITCDSAQHFADWSYCSFPARIASRLMGFSLTTQIGPPWKKAMTPAGGSLQSDFQRLLQLEFEHLIGAHGGLCRGGAHEKLREAVARAFRTTQS